MSNKAVFRANDGTTRLTCCGEPPGSTFCVCHDPPVSPAQRAANAAAKDAARTPAPSAAEVLTAARDAEVVYTDEHGTPDAWRSPKNKRTRREAEILAASHRAGFEARMAAANRAPAPSAEAPDPWEAQIQALRADRGITPAPAIDGARASYAPPDPWADAIAARRRERGLEAR